MRDHRTVAAESIQRFACSQVLLDEVSKGGEAAFMRAVAATALLWFSTSGYGPSQYSRVTPAHCAAESDPMRRGVLAAALSLRDLLQLSPDGRKALADLALQPFRQQAEGPRG